MSRSFYLVQRIKRSWRADHPAGENASALAKLRNPFGYGTLGDYDLDYMGAAEFEWGAIPDALNRLRDAGKEPPYELQERLNGATKPRFGDDWRTHVWWGLGENVMWAFHDDGHLPRMLESMVREVAAA